VTPLAQIVVRDCEKYPGLMGRFIESKLALQHGLITPEQFELELLAIVNDREWIERQIAYVMAAEEYGPLIYAD
jgi:hypothetical protein